MILVKFNGSRCQCPEDVVVSSEPQSNFRGPGLRRGGTAGSVLVAPHFKNIRELGRRFSRHANWFCSDGRFPNLWNELPRFPSHSLVRGLFCKMRVIRAVAALNSGAVGSRQGARYAGLALRAAAFNSPSAPCYSFRLSGLRHFSRSPLSRASSAAEQAYAFPELDCIRWTMRQC